MLPPIVSQAIADSIATLQRLVREPVSAPGYGVDLVCFSDVEPNLRETDTSTIESLSQDLFHRLTSDRGSQPDDPDFGTNIARLLHKGMTQKQIAMASASIASECGKDDRVEPSGTAVDFDMNVSTKALRVTIRITPRDPNLSVFALVIVLGVNIQPFVEAIRKGLQ